MTIAMAEEPEALSFTPLNPKASEHDDGLLAFDEVRPRLFGIAYRMLGSAAEAEDIVQDVWLRWQATDRSVVENPPAFLATTPTRLCINSPRAPDPGERPMLALGFPNQWIPAAILAGARSVVKHWDLLSCFFLKN